MRKNRMPTKSKTKEYTHDPRIDNALLMHGGTDEIDIPGAALQKIISDALKPDCDDQIESLRLQNEALEEHNANQAREIDSLKLEVRELRDRLQGRIYE